MIKKMMVSSLIGLCCASSVMAGTVEYKSLVSEAPSRFYVGAAGGYGTVNGAYKQDGNTSMGRFVLGYRAKEYRQNLFGLELGVQSGNTMRLSATNNVIEAAGGLPIQSTLKPFVDLLLTVKGQFMSDCPLSYLIKAGIAYRQLQLNDRTSSKDTLNKVNGELQLGFGYNATKNMMFTAFYQGIYSNGNARVGLNANQNVTISSIPTQQAGFLGLEYSFA